MFWRAFLPLLLLLLLVTFTRGSHDVDVLFKLKQVLQQSGDDVLDSWNSGNSPCNFSGISCNIYQSVTQIDLSSKGLAGNLPFDSICQLEYLKYLNLSNNSLTGLINDDDLKNCSKLQKLDLSFNLFHGAVPDLTPLGELKELYLNMNSFTGRFPWKSLQSMTHRLVVLSIGDNLFDTTPFPLEVLSLNKLTVLYLTNSSLEGEIPEGIGNLTELGNLELSHNHLWGDIPADIVKLAKLWQLELYDNSLSGRLPVGFGNLTALENLDASNNSLEGDLSELRSLQRLVNLQLFENHLSGEIPQEFGDFKHLTGLSLYRNKLSGPLPQLIGSWADFDFIDVSENLLTGPVPPNMCNNRKMTDILMTDNKFTGGIPETYSACLSLTRLRICNNLLSGSIPSGIWSLPNLYFIDLAQNQFEGPMTSDIGNAKSLEQLRVQGNRFSGIFPREISRASSLVSIDVSCNQFGGKIPTDIGHLKKLNNLYLQENTFSDVIPDSLGNCTSLNIVNLAGNSLSGQIPGSLGSLPSLNSLNLSRNELSGQIPSRLSYLELSLLDLSHNKLVGHVPRSLSNQANEESFIGNPGLCLHVCSSDSGKSRRVRTLISCFLTGTMVLLISLAAFIFIKKKNKEQEKTFKSDSWEIKSFRKLTFREEEILDMIKQENLIGKGGSGNVYKVVLGNGVELAVKHIWNIGPHGGKLSESGNLSEFDAEVATLSSIRHVNIVKLYCSITSEDSSLLVYEYLPNGSLWDRLHTCADPNLDWEKRYEIAVGAAKGLEYLHHGCDRPVLHRDVKSSNILLDEFFKPRIADFGLAKIVQCSTAGSQVKQVIAGTHGYIAPEYGYTCNVKEKSDVYSFGVVLMELVTGKKPIEAEFGENKDIVNWVCGKMAQGVDIKNMVHSSISDEEMREGAAKVLRIGVMCTARLPALRPYMRTVVQMLMDAEPCRLVDIKIDKDQGSLTMHPKFCAGVAS